MDQRLAILVPTRGRPDNLRALINCFAVTEATYADGVALVAVTDADDPRLEDYQSMMLRLRIQNPGLDIHEIVLPQWLPLVPKLNYAAQLLADDWYALGFMGDDHWPRTKHWHRQFLGVLGELGTGIAYGNDLIQGHKLPTQWVMTGDVVQAWGGMVPARVEHLYCDNAVLMAGRALGRLRYLPEVIIEHMHPVAGKAKVDEQYARVNSPVQYEQDGLRYQKWLRSGGPGKAAAKVWTYLREHQLEVREA